MYMTDEGCSASSVQDQPQMLEVYGRKWFGLYFLNLYVPILTPNLHCTETMLQFSEDTNLSAVSHIKGQPSINSGLVLPSGQTVTLGLLAIITLLHICTIPTASAIF
jgi:hypothetical protein